MQAPFGQVDPSTGPPVGPDGPHGPRAPGALLEVDAGWAPSPAGKAHGWKAQNTAVPVVESQNLFVRAQGKRPTSSHESLIAQPSERAPRTRRTPDRRQPGLGDR